MSATPTSRTPFLVRGVVGLGLAGALVTGLAACDFGPDRAAVGTSPAAVSVPTAVVVPTPYATSSSGSSSSGSSSGSSGSSSKGSTSTGSGSSGSAGSSSTSSDPYDVYENSNDGYFDHCQWSQGCGMSTGAWNGADSNSITGDTGTQPLDTTYGSYRSDGSYDDDTYYGSSYGGTYEDSYGSSSYSSSSGE